MRQLRHGVQLKKVEHVGGHSVEYELTPYEILMEDIRSRRYTLNKVMVWFFGVVSFLAGHRTYFYMCKEAGVRRIYLLLK